MIEEYIGDRCGKLEKDKIQLQSSIFSEINQASIELNTLSNFIYELINEKRKILVGPLEKLKKEQEDLVKKNPVSISWANEIYERQIRNVSTLVKIKDIIESI